MNELTASVAAELVSGDVVRLKARIEIAMRSYGEAVELFIDGLENSGSDYDRMMAKQGYLLAAAETIGSIAEICGYRDISDKAVFLKAAARSYLDDADLRAHQQGFDKRFALDEWKSRVFESRLKTRAGRAYCIWELYSREVEVAEKFDDLVLKFLLDLTLEFPIGAWECACCLAASGNCGECGYGEDHNICSSSGSTYNMLSKSHYAILKCIRSTIWDLKRSNNLRETAESSPDSAEVATEYSRWHDDEIFGDFEVVKGEYD